ncbi:DUF882 domain-containing protein, partial [Candidatus Peregrinibacteria bacterium]|nr:DUF882 domain-containing protein [Candidatus Peregrinibacteria bacterium]
DKREFAGKVIGNDPKTEISVIRIDAKDLQYVKAGTYWTVKSGNNVEYYHKYARIDPRLVALIENIRSDAGVPMIVNEGFRSYLENKRMYDNRNEKPAYGSRHVSGQALDFENTNNKILKSALYLMRNDGGIGLYPGKNAVHFDCRRSKRRWTKGQWDKNKEWPRERWLSKNDVQEVKDRIAGKKRKRKKK